MLTFISENTKTLALPSLLLGLSATGLAPKYPKLSIWIGSISVILFCSIWIIYLFLWTFNYFTPRRFANSIFAIDQSNNIALILHPHYHRYQPPGTRLGYHEAPHLTVKDVMQDELGLSSDDYLLLSNETKLTKYGNNQIVPKPYIVKTEKGKHRLGVVEHYDYVYVCFVGGNKIDLQSSLSPRWFSLEELEKFSKDNVEQIPWSDVIPIFKRILGEIEVLKKYENLKL